MKKKLLLIACCALSSATIAGTMGATALESNIATLSLGPAWSNPGKSQTIFLQPDIEKYYSSNKGTNTLISSELFVGRQRLINEIISAQLGFALAASSPATIGGQVWEDGDLNFSNYNYRYKISHEHLALKGKLLANTSTMISPYISGSVGVGINHAYGFTINPIVFQEIAAPPFNSNTTAAFTYTLGAGFQQAVREHWSVGLGYELGDWGKSNLNRAEGQTTDNGLSLSHLYTQQLQFSLTYSA